MQGAIRIRGARENNLRGVDLDIERGTLVVVCGVSGSGKSSLAFDTLHAEGQRRYLDALGVPLTGLKRPEVDLVAGLPPTLALDQRAPAPTRRSTAGTLADVDVLLRVIFAREGLQHCPDCGDPVRPKTADEIVAELLEAPTGSRVVLEAPIDVRSDPEGVLEEVVRSGFTRIRVGGEVHRIESLSSDRLSEVEQFTVVVDRVRLGPGKAGRLYEGVRMAIRAGRGLLVAEVDGERVPFVEQPVCLNCRRRLPRLEPGLFSPSSGAGACPSCEGLGGPECEGTGLREEARAVSWCGRSLPELLALPATALRLWLSEQQAEVAALALAELCERLEVLEALNLDVPLGRRGHELAAGEVQRLRLARLGASALSGVLFVLDEPAAGLADPAGVIRVLARLRNQGATVLVVTHHARIVAAADRVLEFGPGAGEQGGSLIFDGAPAALLRADTPSGRWFSRRTTLSAAPRRPADLQVGEVTVVEQGLTALVGPTGSGKSRLLDALMHTAKQGTRFEGVVNTDSSAVRRSKRSLPATYVGLWDTLRALLASTREAQIRGLKAADFSLNQKGGRCEACKGTGIRQIVLEVLPDVVGVCPVCRGQRFGRDVLEVRWRGAHAAELLDLSAAAARSLLSGHPKLERALRALVEVGLGYVPLGQSTATLSGGEAHRLKLARELVRRRKDTLYLLDDPTRGLHPADSALLLATLLELSRQGATVVVATHDPAFAEACHHQIVLG